MAAQEIDLMAERRTMIDLIATTRGRSVRVALFGALLHRINPDRPTTEEERAASARVLADTVNWIERVAVLLSTGKDPWGKLPGPVCAWVPQFSRKWPETVRKVETMAVLSRRVSDSVTENSHCLGQALDAHYEFRRDGFMDAMSKYCDSMWAEIDTDREAEVARAKSAGHAIQQTLARLEAIGKHVRLVSLNASVEAARIGDVGKGLGVIATEFKSLAEEIQTLSVNAETEIAAFSGKSQEPRAKGKAAIAAE